jgi:hypothetical protein
MEGTCLRFFVVGVEVAWYKESSCYGSPRVIHVSDDSTHATQLSFKMKLVPNLQYKDIFIFICK